MMYRINNILVVVASIVLCAILPSTLLCGENNSADIATAKAQYEANAKERPVVFIPNRGQVVDSDGNPRPDLLYSTSGGGVQLYFRKTGISYVFARVEEQPKPVNGTISEATGKPMRPIEESMDEPLVSVYRMDMELEGCNTNAEIVSEEQTKEYFNYYLAHCPEGITEVHGYKRVVYKNIYNNIDLVFHSSKYGVKYDFVVRPGGDASAIKMRYDNAEDIALKAGRKLQLSTPLGSIQEDAPVTYSITNNTYQPLAMNGRPVRSHFVLEGNTIGFAVEEYDHNQTLVIDPYVLWSTYMGSGLKEHIEGITVEALDYEEYRHPATQRVIVTGWTVAASFPEPTWANKKISVYKGNTDAFLASISAEGELLWYTYFGGENFDRANAVACANPYRYNENSTYSSSLYAITGRTSSRQTIGGASSGYTTYQNAFGGGEADAFVAVFNNYGQRLWSTYLGGDGAEYGHDIAMYFNGNTATIGITGQTESADFPVAPTGNSADWEYSKDIDAFLTTFADNGTLQWSRRFGGNKKDVALAVDVNSSGYWAIGGWTTSDREIYNNAILGTFGGSVDMLIAKFTPTGNVVAATYFGDNEGSVRREDYCTSIAFNHEGDIFVGGYAHAESDGLYAWGSPSSIHQATYGGGSFDGVLVKFTSNLDDLIWSTMYGGDNDDRIEDIAIDYYGDIWIVGRTNSLPTSNIADGRLMGYKWDNTTGDWKVLQDKRFTDWKFPNANVAQYDTFLAKFDTDGQRTWSSYYGNKGSNIGVSISSGYFYGIAIAGWTQFGDQTAVPTFNTENLQENPDGCEGGFVMLMREFGFPAYYGYRINTVDIAIDSKDNMVLIANVDPHNSGVPILPVTNGAYQTMQQASYNGAIYKLDSAGAPIWSTFYGGAKETELIAVDINPQDQIAVVGHEAISSFGDYLSPAPPANGYFRVSFTKGILALFDRNGLLINNSMLSGSDGTTVGLTDVAFAPDGSIVAFGYTNDDQFVGCSGGAFDGLIVKYSSELANILWSKCWGGDQHDMIYMGRVTAENEILVGCYSNSNSQTFPSCAQWILDGSVTGNLPFSFLSKFDCSGNCAWSNRFGNTLTDIGDMALLPNNQLAIVGSTIYSGFPVTSDAWQNQINQGEPFVSTWYSDGIITKMDVATGNITWSTFFGDKRSDGMTSVAVDQDGSLIIGFVGHSVEGSSLPMSYTYDPFVSGQDNFGVLKVNNANQFVWGHLLFASSQFFDATHKKLAGDFIGWPNGVAVNSQNRYIFGCSNRIGGMLNSEGVDPRLLLDSRKAVGHSSVARVRAFHFVLTKDGELWSAP